MPGSSRPRRREQVMNGLTVGFVALGVLAGAALLVTALSETVAQGDRVGLVEVSGVIRDPNPIVRQLNYFTETSPVPVILLRIESPGGTVGASQEIFRQVQYTRERGIKVVASMGSIAASGGYYIAVAADTIMANPGTLTGSIGVIAEFIQADRLLQKIGIGFNVIKSGRFKDTGSLARPMEREERDRLQAVIDDAYEQFLEAIITSRGMSRDTLEAIAQGQVFTGRMALESGLIDTLGNFDDAKRLARKVGGLPESAPVVRAPKREASLVRRLVGQVAEVWDQPSTSVSYRMP